MGRHQVAVVATATASATTAGPPHPPHHHHHPSAQLVPRWQLVVKIGSRLTESGGTFPASARCATVDSLIVHIRSQPAQNLCGCCAARGVQYSLATHRRARGDTKQDPAADGVRADRACISDRQHSITRECVAAFFSDACLIFSSSFFLAAGAGARGAAGAEGAAGAVDAVEATRAADQGPTPKRRRRERRRREARTHTPRTGGRVPPCPPSFSSHQTKIPAASRSQKKSKDDRQSRSRSRSAASRSSS